MLERDESGLTYTIRYDLVNDTKGKFQQNLNPNNPPYTQNKKTKVSTEEQKQSRRGFVNEIMQVYRQCELDENYEDRARREESDMCFLIETVEFKGTFEVLNKTSLVRVMNLLYAAQNLSLDGQKDYVEALIEKPEISEFLCNMEKMVFSIECQKKHKKEKIMEQ